MCEPIEKLETVRKPILRRSLRIYDYFIVLLKIQNYYLQVVFVSNRGNIYEECVFN